MPHIPIDLAQARILLSNDDGIDAPGLKVLERIARSLSKDVWIVAPEREQSGASHSLTLRQPLRIRKLGPKRFSVDGTPTDCVLLAINEIMRKRRPTLLLSGVNLGGNMGEDMTYSGTVAVAMEGTLLEVPSIAFSLATVNGQKPIWDAAAVHLPGVIRALAGAPWPANTLVNVNVPNLPANEIRGVKATAQGQRKLGGNIVGATDPRGRPYYWIGPNRDEDAEKPGTDIWAVAQGYVAVTPAFLNLTHQAALAELGELFP
ncbi:MAG TPA: 5'/3'-nucleotidase SurE [Aliidongia sp.]|uniref:5'/3'-nucleotidase SurE n=1 Tax=Aliidongia sp. TaxID=1914230 RepID=UPI002DDD5850|nr:5'/3'-nucleotidase SurE [Aliidongia sp.]HEV2673221.1 5'/3'-nucleotidase SurE [Aliidongia sp.]